MQAFTPTSAYDFVAVEDLYGITEDLLERMEKVRGVPSYLETGRVVGDKSYRNIVGLRGLGRRNQFTCSSTFVKEMDLSSQTD